MDRTATILAQAIEAVCPVVSVVIGDPIDRATWHAAFAEVATNQQREAAARVLATFDPTAPTTADVNVERDRRLRQFPFAGRPFDFVNGRGSDINITGAGTLALAAIIGGHGGTLRWVDPGADFMWIAADNTSVPMDAETCLAFAQAAASWKARHVVRARALKETVPIPADYADDARWA